jgi:hypothetical protein
LLNGTKPLLEGYFFVLPQPIQGNSNSSDGLPGSRRSPIPACATYENISISSVMPRPLL